jgi:6-bladed beta-propeller
MIYLGRYLILICSLLISCNMSDTNNESSDSDIKKINIIDSDSRTKYSFNNFFEIIDIVPLESSENALIAEAQKIFCVDNRFFIFDRRFSMVKVFNREGKFLYQIGQIGQAEGEYTHLDDVDFNRKDKTFSFFSNSERSIFTYDVEGEYLKKFKVNFYAFGLANIGKDSTFFNINFNLSDESKNKNLLLTNSEGKILNRYFPYQTGFDVPSSASSGFLSKTNEGILYSTSYDDTFYQFSNGKWKAKYRFDLNELKVPLIKIRNMNEFKKNIMNYSYLTDKCIKRFTEKAFLLKI